MPRKDATDADGISAIRYRLERLRLIGGQLPSTFDLYNENTSSRFPMETGECYLLYVQRDRKGRYYVDVCGHSRLLFGAGCAMTTAARRGEIVNRPSEPQRLSRKPP